MGRDIIKKRFLWGGEKERPCGQLWLEGESIPTRLFYSDLQAEEKTAMTGTNL